MEDQEKGQAGDLRSHNLARLRETLETLLRLGFALLGGCYVVGLLILNSYLAQFGISSLNILDVQYIMAGALWIFLIVFVCCQLLLIFEGPKYIKQAWKQGLRLLPIMTAVILGLSPIMLIYVVQFASGFELRLTNGSNPRPLFIVLGILILTALTVRYLWNDIRALLAAIVPEHATDKVEPVTKWINLFMALFRTVLVIGLIPAYSFSVFPKLSSALGGGRPQEVEFLGNVKHIDTLNSIGLSVSSEKRRFGPLEVIFEGSDFFLVAPPKDVKSEDNLKAIRINKDLIDAAFYRTRGEDGRKATTDARKEVPKDDSRDKHP